MAFILGPNVSPGLTYTPQFTLENLPPCVKLTLDVTNGSIFYQIKRLDGLSGPGGSWNPETFSVPGSKGITRNGITGIRVRSAAITSPVTLVTAELLLAGEA